MTLRDLLPHLDQPVASGSLDTPITSLAYDSRNAGPGTLFFALRGTTMDGHRFIPAAIQAGCAAIVAEQAPEAESQVPWIHVRHARTALAQAAAAFHGHPSRQLKLCGVTGTNGKTTTSFMVHHLLNAAQVRSGLIGTLFYDLGGDRVAATHTTPESLEIHQLLSRMVEAGCRACSMEVSSHALDQQRAHGLVFDAAIFTNLTQDHLDYHGTMENYFAAKSKLFEMVAAQQHGHLVINSDDLWGRKLITRHESTGRVVRFGYGVSADYRAVNVRSDLTGTSFELEVKGRSFLVRLPFIGDFNVYNALGAIAAVHSLGLNLRESLQHLRHAPQVPGRLERVNEHTRPHIFVDYAHTPDALVNALATLRALKPSRIITVFGCGGDRDRTKRPKMAAAAEQGSDICILTSDNPRSEDPSAIIAEAAQGFSRQARVAKIIDRHQAIQTAIEGARDGDIVLIAGKGHEDYQEIQGVKHPFDDRKVARQCLLQLRQAEAAAELEAERQAASERPSRH
jgi:UDP-N-acetylmuramoyl-L-alanyl-D-glutamate--2,6-diaminopimelate ligase